MSSTLLFRKTPRPPKEFGLCGQPLKGVFARQFYGHDGSLCGGIVTIGTESLGWLQGVKCSYSGHHPDDKDLREIVSLLDKIIETINDGRTVDMWFEG